MTIQEFIDSQRLRMEVRKIESRPDGLMEESAIIGGRRIIQKHYRYTIVTHDDKRMSGYYSQGEAHKNPPKLADVLDCLAMDASTVEGARSFEEWARNLGYDEDSRKAERVYNACVEEAEKLRNLLGERRYRYLLDKVERL